MEEWKNGRMEEWKMEGEEWKNGRGEEWKNGRWKNGRWKGEEWKMEEWKGGRMEEWKDGIGVPSDRKQLIGRSDLRIATDNNMLTKQ